MDALKKYQQARALAEVNYGTRLTEAKRLMSEAIIIFEEDLQKAKEEFRNNKDTSLPPQVLE